ncbi:hypothetical protein [Chitinophaga pinensis]|uniref:Uncharacterized protein n=1 Tax=Chitinophaga pinensis TaxID=79329 RepID=A0A5C6LJE3_9BACT|nr:hypothetical protein [Chitinophaga pinensis]TWV92993.1 hypothetical protein FEF09_27820 [Chitinophaga pinensis]
MNKRALYLVLTVLFVLTSLGNLIASPENGRKGFTEIGHQTDGNYYYTFYADLSKDPNAIAYIQVQKIPPEKYYNLIILKARCFSVNRYSASKTKQLFPFTTVPNWFQKILPV